MPAVALAIPVSGYTDMHIHLLPALDDGPTDMDEAVALAKRMEALGVATVVVTPHEHRFGFVGAARILAGLLLLQAALNDAGARLKLIAGSEIALDPTMAADLKSGRILTIGSTKYVLVEIAQGVTAPALNALYELQMAGFTPVIAHAELAGGPGGIAAVSDLAQRGCVLQVTAASLTGAMGGWAKEAADKMAERDIIQLIASDAHHPVSERVEAFFSFRLPFAKKWGLERFSRIMFDNPHRILAGESIV
jgi:protein-tyrosine phosphatase